MKSLSKHFLVSVILSWIVCASISWSQDKREPIKVAVLPSTDSSTYNLGTPLQKALADLYQQSGYSPSLSDQPLEGFTPIEVGRAMQEQKVSTLSFVLLEQERLSVFLFEKDHPLQFIVSSKPLKETPTSLVSSDVIQTKFKSAFDEVIQAHREEQYQELPGAKSQKLAGSPRFTQRDPKIAEESKLLFREMASQIESSVYLGAHMGLSRFSNSDSTLSTATFGLSSGYVINPSFSVEGGLWASTYLMGSFGGRYTIPLKEDMVKLSVGLDVASIFAEISQNSGYSSSSLSPQLRRGTLFVGPGFFFDIPLLGATLRGDLRFFIGDATIIVGSYGLVYYL